VADGKPPVRPEDYVDADVTVPGAPFRGGQPPRIATPLGGGLRTPVRPPPRGSPPLGQRHTQPGTPVAEPRTTLNDLPAARPPGDELVKVEVLPPPEKLAPTLYLTRAPDSAAAASVRVLRHRLLERQAGRVIAVTSPGRREGKTTLAINLAMALGESGRARVLLLEVNLRHAALARLLGFRPPVCFAEQLEFHRTHPVQPWVVVEQLSPHLHLAAVSPDAQPRALIDGPAVAIAIEQLRGAGYDHIVVDCPPVLGSADVNLIEEHVDGVLFAMWVRRSRTRALRRAVDQIGRRKVLGTALIGG
jgi:Mrp family chromosome partitioning ATPase